jgi:hypothetical protein
MVEFEDLAITGELIKSMPEAERYFEIIEKPYYENYPTESDPTGEKKRKLCLKVRLGTGQEGTYYPNKTSARRIATITKETDMDKWLGKSFIWGEIVQQKVAGQTKDVLYITESYPRVEKQA